MILSLARIISSVAWIGYIKKGSGSVAALVTALIWWLVLRNQQVNNLVVAAVIVAIFIAGVWSASVVEKVWGKDSSRVVIDEIGGMCVSLYLVPVCLPYIIIGFILFRFFDIAKPLFIRKSEKLPGGWGVMADDLLAGICSNLILQVIARFNLC
jgi:phosphatidylglycerophosphatase A